MYAVSLLEHPNILERLKLINCAPFLIVNKDGSSGVGMVTRYYEKGGLDSRLGKAGFREDILQYNMIDLLWSAGALPPAPIRSCCQRHAIPPCSEHDSSRHQAWSALMRRGLNRVYPVQAISLCATGSLATARYLNRTPRTHTPPQTLGSSSSATLD